MARSKKSSSANRTASLIVVVLLLAVGGGYLGATLRGGGGGAATASSSGEGAFLEGIKQRGELRVGVALSPPMTVQQKDGSYGGPNLIPLQNLATELNVKLTPVPAEWNNIVAGLQAGRYDFAANLDQTVPRSMAISFTDYVWDYPGTFLVKADSPYKTADDLLKASGSIGTAQGSALEYALKTRTKNITSMKEYSNVVSALGAGRVIAEFADYPTTLSQAQADPTLKIIIPSPPIYLGKAAYGVPPTIDTRSLNVVNIAIDRAKNDNSLDAAYAQAKYMPADRLVASGSDLLKK